MERGLLVCSLLLYLFYTDTYLDLGEHFAFLSLIGIGSGLLSISVWYWLANRLGKKCTWALGVLLYFIAVIGAGFLEPSKANIEALAAVIILSYIGSTPIVALSPSVLADIVDFSTWKFGVDRAATYFLRLHLFLKNLNGYRWRY